MQTYQAFFSYSHSDAAADPEFVEAFTKKLQLRVSNKMTNAKLDIWQDKNKIRVGEKWNSTIEDAVRASDVMIILLSPKWVESNFCRKEYATFVEVESERTYGGYIAPILGRELVTQRKHFTKDQMETVKELEKRQYFKAPAASFLELTSDQRTSLVDQIADDIAGMIERIRQLPEVTDGRTQRRRREVSGKEFSVKARNFEEVDFIDRPEIEMRHLVGGSMALMGQLDFVDRLYVQADKARIEFGIRRAHLTVKDNLGHEIERSGHLTSGPHNVRYVTFRNDPEALVVSIDPPSGHRTLGELALPPGPDPGENRLSEIGIVPSSGELDLSAELSVSLCVEGLSFAEGTITPRSNALKAAVEAIATIAAAKEKGSERGRMIRQVRIRKPRR